MNYIASPFVGIASDFGVKKAGLSFYAPFGGKSKYDKAKTSSNFQGLMMGLSVGGLSKAK